MEGMWLVGSGRKRGLLGRPLRCSRDREERKVVDLGRFRNGSKGRCDMLLMYRWLSRRMSLDSCAHLSEGAECGGVCVEMEATIPMCYLLWFGRRFASQQIISASRIQKLLRSELCLSLPQQ